MTEASGRTATGQGLFTDSHCHLTDRAFAEDLPEVLRRADEAGVSRMLCIASDVDDSQTALDLAKRPRTDRSPMIWSTAGIHPHAAADAPADTVSRLRELLEHEECVAVGETGLDYFYDHSPRDRQRRLFLDHVALASELALPIVVHNREAETDMSDILRDAGRSVRGVLHCFGGSADLLELALDIGWFVSFTGTSTFKRFDRTLVRDVPEDRYMLETDAPYLAPVPKRGKRNEPGFLPIVAATVADIREESVDTVARRTTANAVAFFGLDARVEAT